MWEACFIKQSTVNGYSPDLKSDIMDNGGGDATYVP